MFDFKKLIKWVLLSFVFSGWSYAAESNLQLYGQIDEFVGDVRAPGSQSHGLGVYDGGLSTAFVGLKGNENLGENLKVKFVLESFFRPTVGAAGSFDGEPFWGRNAFMGLSGSWGELTFGRLTTQLFISTVVFNPLVDSFVFSPSVLHTYSGVGTFPSYDTDQGVIGGTVWDRAIEYKTSNYGGLSGALMYARDSSTVGQNGSKYSGQILYFSNNFSGSVVHQKVNFGTQPGDLGMFFDGFKSQSTTQLSGSYNFTKAKVYAQLMQTKNKRASGSWKVNTVQLGVGIPISAGTFSATYARSKSKGLLGISRNSVGFGYQYPLSKRSEFYVAYLTDKVKGEKRGQSYGLGFKHQF